MKTLNHFELTNLIRQTKGAAIIGILAVTDARAKKTNNPFGTIFKTVRAVGFCGANYGNAVLNEGLRENKSINFIEENLPWGSWLIPCKVIEHKGDLYLRLQSTAGQRQRQPAKVLGYQSETGQALTFKQIEKFLPAKTESAKQVGAGIDTGKTVMVRTYKFSSLKVVRINGQSYQIKN